MYSQYRPRHRFARILLAACAVLTIGFLLFPVLAIIPMSFNDAPRFELIPSNPSFEQYRRLFASPDWMEALWRSVRIALIVMAAATAIGSAAALAIVRLPSRWRPVVEASFMAPQIIPSVVIAASAYFLFIHFGMQGTISGIAIMHTVIALPFVVVLLGGRLQTLSRDLTQASSNLGAGPFRTFWHITIPQIRTAIVGAGLLAFHASFDEVVLALFLSGARNKTLPVKLWDSILFEVTPILPAISVLVLSIPMLGMLLLLLLRIRRM
jgi:ABC-type spermidine/putrescine transport system permease subunit II